MDHVSIDRQLWEKENRYPAQGDELGKSEAELIFRGEEEREETYEAMVERISTLPSDQFIPERED